jgi:hypothetical protein
VTRIRPRAFASLLWDSSRDCSRDSESHLGPRPTCPYGLVCPLTSRPQHRVCEVKKQTRDGTGKRRKKKTEKKKKKNENRREGEEERKKQEKKAAGGAARQRDRDGRV